MMLAVQMVVTTQGLKEITVHQQNIQVEYAILEQDPAHHQEPVVMALLIVLQTHQHQFLYLPLAAHLEQQ